MDWKAIANRILDGGEPISREEALAVLTSSDDELLDILQAAYLIRKNWFGKKVSLHVLKNAKSGVCPEDCSFCSQSKSSTADIEEYEMQSADEIVQRLRVNKERNVYHTLLYELRGKSSIERQTTEPKRSGNAGSQNP